MTDTAQQKIRIVIAHDYDILRDGLYYLLSREKDLDIVAMFSTGDEVPIYIAGGPDILLLGVNIRNLDGTATREALQATANRTKMIALTGSQTNNEELVRALELGAAAVLPQEAPTVILFETIRQLHSGQMRPLSKDAAFMRIVPCRFDAEGNELPFRTRSRPERGEHESRDETRESDLQETPCDFSKILKELQSEREQIDLAMREFGKPDEDDPPSER
jgi:DNA-binding NarL/FixJ family response regulator